MPDSEKQPHKSSPETNAKGEIITRPHGWQGATCKTCKKPIGMIGGVWKHFK